jgi:hypothetical protein
MLKEQAEKEKKRNSDCLSCFHIPGISCIICNAEKKIWCRLKLEFAYYCMRYAKATLMNSSEPQTVECNCRLAEFSDLEDVL